MGWRCEGADADGGDEHQREAESEDAGERHKEGLLRVEVIGEALARTYSCRCDRRHVTQAAQAARPSARSRRARRADHRQKVEIISGIVFRAAIALQVSEPAAFFVSGAGPSRIVTEQNFRKKFPEVPVPQVVNEFAFRTFSGNSY
jgi:hypothetical protein